jgi:SAM-dependent methyltransferase
MTNGESPFDSLATAYDRWFEEKGRLIFEIEVRAFQKVLASLPRPWLEVGVGSGRFAQALGIETGVDPSTRLLEMARDRGIAAYLGSGEDSTFPPGSFGTVFLIVTICFVDSPQMVLREAYRILKPDGKVVLGLVLRESPWGQHYLREKEKGHKFYKYASFYSYSEVETFLNNAGFNIEKAISTLFRRPGQVREMEAPRDGYSPDAGFTIVVAAKSG